VGARRPRLDPRVVQVLRVVAAGLAGLSVVTLAVAGTARATVLDRRYYQAVLDDEHAYDRLYDEVLVDPASAKVTSDLLARLPAPPTTVLSKPEDRAAAVHSAPTGRSADRPCPGLSRSTRNACTHADRAAQSDPRVVRVSQRLGTATDGRGERCRPQRPECRDVAGGGLVPRLSATPRVTAEDGMPSGPISSRLLPLGSGSVRSATNAPASATAATSRLVRLTG
jgi:hypothetical protein